MVISTYALRDSSKVNSLYNNTTTQIKDDDYDDDDDDNTSTTRVIYTDEAYPKKKKKKQRQQKSALYSSSDFYTPNDPQYHHYNNISTATRTNSTKLKRKMVKKKTNTSSTKKKMNTSTRKKKKVGATTSATVAASASPTVSAASAASTASGIVRVSSPGKNDVLCGRGGNVNNHEGNRYYRSIVQVEKENYTLNANKAEKTTICNNIIDRIHNLEPKGRFLMKQTGTNYWVEVDHGKAVAKTSQALREGAPALRAQTKSTTASDDVTITSRNTVKRGRKSTTGARKRAKLGSRTRSKNNYKIEKSEEKEPEEDVPSHHIIAPMSNGVRGKQIISRSDPNEAAGEEVVGSTSEDVANPSLSTSGGNLDVEDGETKEERENRIKKLREIYKPTSRPNSLLLTPVSPIKSPPTNGNENTPSQPAASAEISIDVEQNMIPILPTDPSAVVGKPSSSFFRAHSLATSEDMKGCSENFRTDGEFVNPFANETSDYQVNKAVDALNGAETNVTAGGIDKNGSVFTSPTTVSTAVIDSSLMSTEIANNRNSHSPSTEKGNSRISARDERSYSVAYKSEPSVYRTNSLIGTSNGPDMGSDG